MKGSTTVLTLLALGIAGIWLASYEAERAPAGGAPGAAMLNTSRGSTIRLNHAGVVLWNGEGLSSAAMTVQCAEGGVAYGLYGKAAVALNGNSMTIGRGGYVRTETGERRNVVSSDRDDLVAIGAIQRDADPFVFNAKTGEGLEIARRHCG